MSINTGKVNLKRKLILALEAIVLLLLVFYWVFTYKNTLYIQTELSKETYLAPGSYTIELKYETTSQLNCTLQANDNEYFLKANPFYLSKNKRLVSYDFYTTGDIDKLQVVVEGEEGAIYSIDSVSIHSNTHNARIMIFVWLMLCLVADIILWELLREESLKLCMFMLLLAFFASLPGFMDGIFSGHDDTFQMLRIEGIALGLKDGQFPVRMNMIFEDGYGYPNDIFYGDMLLYIPAILRLIGFTLTSSYKIYIFVVNFMTALAAYLCGHSIFKKKNIAYIVAAAYTLSAYRLCNIWIRMAVGEYSAMIFIPIIVMAIWYIYTQDVESKDYLYNAIYLAAGLALIIYTHVLSTEIMVIVIAFVAIFEFKKTFRSQTFKALGLAIINFLLLGLAFIVPFLDYYLNNDIKVKEAKWHYIQIDGAFISDYFSFFRSIRGGSEVNIADRMLMTPGLVLMAALVAGCILMVEKKAGHSIKVFTLASIILLFVASNLFPWNTVADIPFVGNIVTMVQFPYRYLAVATMMLAILLGAIMEYAEEKYSCKELGTHVVLGATFLMSTFFLSSYASEISQVNYVDTAELYYNFDVINGGEYLLKDTDSTDLRHDCITENATSVIIGEKGTDMTLAVTTRGDATIEIPRFNYPNYVAMDESGRCLNIVTGTNNRIKILVPQAYSGNIQVRYLVPWYFRVAEVISLVAFVALIFFCIKRCNYGKTHSQELQKA